MDHLEIKSEITVDAVGTVSGLAWPFGTIDKSGDMIEPGAFAGSTGPLPMLWSHERGAPIGVWTEITEEARGLIVKGRLFSEIVPRARDAYELLKSGIVTGLSIGFNDTKATPRAGGRLIQSLRLQEISLASSPLNTGARVLSVKSETSPGEAALQLAAAIHRAAAALRIERN